MTDPRNNSDRIKEILQARGLTYDDIASEIGISRQAVAQIVHGDTQGATARYAFAKVLGVEVSDLWADAA